VQPVQISSKSALRWVEYVYATTLLFLLTQGPVLRLWRTAELYTSVPIAPTVQATFIAVQIPALMMLSRRGLSREMFRGPIALLVALTTWMLMSTTWTNLSRYTIVEAISFTVTAATGLYFAQSFSVRKQIFVIFSAMQLGVMYSYIAVKLAWPETIDGEGNWVGVYFNRNSLAPVAMLGLLSAAVVLYILVREVRGNLRLPLLAICSVLVAIDAAVYLRSGSSTSFGAAVIFVFVGAVWTLVRWFKQTRQVPTFEIQRVFYPAFVAVMLLSAWIGFRYQQLIIGWFGKADFFNGRSALWHFSWAGVLERPILGWGWRAAWSTPEFLKRDLWWTTSDAQLSHNGFLEVLLGGGFIAGFMFFVFIIWSGWVRVGSVCKEELGQWSFAVAAFILVANSQEVFITGNHFLWVLLVASISRVKPAPVQSAETSSTPST
jgi:O-antigen ligase